MKRKEMTTRHDINQQQYQNKSNAYLSSAVHAQGDEFKKMQALIQQNRLKTVLDLGCGGGHVTYQLASYVDEITAYDLSDEMVTTVLHEAQQRQLFQVNGQQGPAEKLPFESERFDAVVSRYSAHHWQSVPQALNEVWRVLKPYGKAVFVDILGHASPLLDTFLQSMETLRDPSHVRNYSLGEWINFAENAGFAIETLDQQQLPLEFRSWVERMQTPLHAVESLRYLQQHTTDQIKNYYQIQNDGSFVSPVVYLVLSKIK